MKKFLIIFIMFLFGTSVLAEVNMPSAPVSYKRTAQTVDSVSGVESGSGAASTPLSSDAKALGNALLSQNQSAFSQAYKSMLSKGATGIKSEGHINSCPYRKNISITAGGRTYKGQKCAKVSYNYKGKHYEDAFCK